MPRSRAETRGPMIAALRALPLGRRPRILDAGMGAGCLGAVIRAAFPHCELTGIDKWLRYLVDPQCRQTAGWPSLSLYDSLIGGPAGELMAFFGAVSPGAYDAIVFGDVLEHIPEGQARAVLARACQVAAVGVVVNTPVRDYPQGPIWNNEAERHLWWRPRDWWVALGGEHVGGSDAVATFLFRAGACDAPALSVVIPAFNRLPYVDLCIRSLLRTEAPPWRFEIIVVDDGSIDGTDAHVRREFGHRNVTCVRRTVNVGRPNCPGLARNVGIRAARARRVAFLDCDTFHARDAISATLAYDGPPAVIRAAGAWLLEAKAPPAPGAEYQAVTAAFPSAGATCFRGHVLAAGEDPARAAQIPAQMWWATERDILLEIGGFDERFTVYGAEDFDMFSRLLRKGLPLHWLPGQYAIGLFAPRCAGPRDVIDEGQNARQHQLWRKDETILRNQCVDWGRQHCEEP